MNYDIYITTNRYLLRVVYINSEPQNVIDTYAKF